MIAAAPLSAAAYLTRVSTRSMNSGIHIQAVDNVIKENVDMLTTMNGPGGEITFGQCHCYQERSMVALQTAA